VDGENGLRSYSSTAASYSHETYTRKKVKVKGPSVQKLE